MKPCDKLDTMRDDFENGRLPLVPTRDQLDTLESSDPVADRPHAG